MAFDAPVGLDEQRAGLDHGAGDNEAKRRRAAALAVLAGGSAPAVEGDAKDAPAHENFNKPGSSVTQATILGGGSVPGAGAGAGETTKKRLSAK